MCIKLKLKGVLIFPYSITASSNPETSLRLAAKILIPEIWVESNRWWRGINIPLC
ncbi:MAG: hypothetical protein J5I59_03730 [Saprospiraceae bacterium]|nr:hypothetical protein [Saprospiraceae bacterium]